VEIAGTGRIAKINSAYNLPDPDERAARLINTVEANLDVPIQHYVEIDLAGFTEVVDAIDGVDVCLERPSRDAGSGFYAPEAGLYTLDGTQALAYVRSRSMQEQQSDGSWKRVDRRADLDRIDRQQEFLRAAVDQSFDSMVTNPVRLNAVLGVIAESISVSNTLNVVSDGLDLAGWFRDFGSEALVTEALDVYELPNRPNSRLGMTEAAATQLDILRGVDEDDVVSDRVSIVLRAPFVSDEVEAAAEKLTDLDFVVVVERDEKLTSTRVAAVRYGADGNLAADLLSAYLGDAVQPVADSSLEGNFLILEVGPDGIEVVGDPHPVTPVPIVGAVGGLSTTTVSPVLAEADSSATTTTTQPVTSTILSVCDSG
jgi:LCP family protein required for cell wall assembly